MRTKSAEKPTTESYKKYRCLVTGASGFIGTKVMERLREMGHDVIPFDIKMGNNLLDWIQVELAVKDVDVVFHLAAQADLTKMAESVEAGQIGTKINVEGTHNVAFACAKHKKWMIYASTVCVYGNQPGAKETPESEDTTLPLPNELYACSKLAGELIMRGYGLNYGMPWTSLRFATIYGEGMRPALGMHVFFTQAIDEKPITVHGNGEQERTLTYVEDLVDGIVATLSHPESQGNIINLSSPTPISANKMAEDIKRITGSPSEIVHIEQRANQTIHENFDVSKAKKLLGWEAKTKWEDGLKATYKWMKKQ